MKRGRLYWFDGMGGCGKTTTAAMLRASLVSRGRPTALLREKDFEPFGGVLRRWKLLRPTVSSGDPDWTLATELADARAIVHREVLLPRLDRGDCVILDRCLLTDAAARATSAEGFQSIVRLNETAGALVPEQVFVFIGSPEICEKRIRQRGRVDSVHDSGLALVERLRELRLKYLWARCWSQRVCVVDGDASRPRQLAEVLARLHQLWGDEHGGHGY